MDCAVFFLCLERHDKHDQDIEKRDEQQNAAPDGCAFPVEDRQREQFCHDDRNDEFAYFHRKADCPDEQPFGISFFRIAGVNCKERLFFLCDCLFFHMRSLYAAESGDSSSRIDQLIPYASSFSVSSEISSSAIV